MKNLLKDVLAPKYELPDGFDAFGMTTVRPDLSTKHGYRWPFPGALAVGAELNPEDGSLSISTDWRGMAADGLSANTLLLLAYRSEEASAIGESGQFSVPEAFVVDVINGERLVEENGRGADLSGADLSRMFLFDVDLTGADLRGADLHDADLSNAHLTAANLEGADLAGANLKCSNLSRANLRSANLEGAVLVDANFSDADMGNANCYFADLTGAYLAYADLKGIDLQSAEIKDTVMQGAFGMTPEQRAYYKDQGALL